MRRLSGFSLMEMMVVLLIVSIIAAASAPMISRKVVQSAENDSPWVWTGVNNNIAYNLGGGAQTAIIGDKALPSGAQKAKLFIKTGANNQPQIGLNNASKTLHMLWTGSTVSMTNKEFQNGATSSVIIGNDTTSNKANTIAIGSGSNIQGAGSIVIGKGITNKGSDSVMIGNGAFEATGGASNIVTIGRKARACTQGVAVGNEAMSCAYGVALGTGANTMMEHSVAIGEKSIVNGANAVGIGAGSKTGSTFTTAVGSGANAMYLSSTALGAKSIANASNSLAIGYSATTGAVNTIAIGKGASAMGENAISIGNGVYTSTDALGIGTGALTQGANATAIGHSAQARSGNTLAIGKNAVASANPSLALGINSLASYNGTTSLGHNSNATSYSATSIGYSATASGTGSIAAGSSASANALETVAIGSSAIADSSYSIAIGASSTSAKKSAIALGYKSSASDNYSIAIGANSSAIGEPSVAIGSSAIAAGTGVAVGASSNACASSFAIGYSSEATHHMSGAIGYDVKPRRSWEIQIGNNSQDVYIPGDLEVGGAIKFQNLEVENLVVYNNALLNVRKGGMTVLRPANKPNEFAEIRADDYEGGDDNTRKYPTDVKKQGRDSSVKAWFDSYMSDRRLKDVGKPFVGGLEQIKKLEVFNYTFKSDKDKTPRVGVMAQDLQKVFPKAVTKGADGFLSIRMEDMFYALINAVKELDAKIDLLVKQQKKINELESKVDKLEKRLEALEKKLK